MSYLEEVKPKVRCDEALRTRRVDASQGLLVTAVLAVPRQYIAVLALSAILSGNGTAP